MTDQSVRARRPRSWLSVVDRGRTPQVREAIRWLELVDVTAFGLLCLASVTAIASTRIDTPALVVVSVGAMVVAVPFVVLRLVHVPAARNAFLQVLEDRSVRLAQPHRPVPEVRRRVHEILDAAEGMSIVFQPIVRLEDGAIVGHEALARFTDGRPPDQWFHEAATVGLGVELEMAAVSIALAAAPDVGYLSVNASPEALGSDVLHDLLERQASGLRLVVEITEHAVVADYEETIAAVNRMRQLGVQVAVDDAGSGISSFQHVLRLKPEIVKLDRWIIDHLDEDPARQALVRFMVAFADELGIQLVAEGIERKEERRTCHAIGVTHGQGYLIGRPASLPATARFAS